MASKRLFRREQRLALRIVLVLAVLLVVVGGPLIVFGELRLRLAHELGVAPGESIPRLAGDDPNVDLIVAPVTEQNPTTGRPVHILVALYIARPGAGGVTLQDLNADRELRLPFDAYDHVAASPDASHVLFVSGDDSPSPQAVLVTVATGDVSPLPSGQRRPDVPGDWDTPLWANVSVACNAVSPDLSYLACLDPPEARYYLAGDWELQVQVYGDFRQQEPIYRGLGFLPIAGWTRDERSLYFQNEVGLWRADIAPGMFESDG